MKKILLTAIITLIGIHTATAQVGIGTEAPKTSLQVVGEPASTTTADGVQVPSLSLAQLDAKITAYGTNQNGAIVYIDDVTNTSSKAETTSINAVGFYYYDADNDTWKTLGNTSTLAAGLVSVTENGNTGYRRADADVDNYGNIGDKAVDLSFSENASETLGATGKYSTTMGYLTTASGFTSTAMGSSTTASGLYSTATGYNTIASGLYSTAMGSGTTASESYSTAMGSGTKASETYSTAMGSGTTASGFTSTAMGSNTTTLGAFSTAMGSNTNASGYTSTAMGSGTTASGGTSTAMGSRTNASGQNSTAMGYNTKASETYSTAMGSGTTASGFTSTAMGSNTTTLGAFSTAMGSNTTASEAYSTAMGSSTTALGAFSTAMGSNTTASDYGSVVLGQFNSRGSTATSATSFSENAPAFVIGNGVDSGTLSDAFVVDFSGNTTAAGTVTASAFVGDGSGLSNINSTLADGSVTSAKILDGEIVNADISTTAEIDQSKIDGLITSLDAKADLDSPTFTGTPSLPAGTIGVTQTAEDNTTAVATTEFVATAVAGVDAAGLVSVTENGNTGFRRADADAANYGDIGSGAVDLGFNDNSNSTQGATGENSVAMGTNTTASGNESTAMGIVTTASSFASTAMGFGTTASGNTSTAMGSNTKALGIYSTAIGNETTASDYGSLVIGQYNNSGSTPTSETSFSASAPAFVIGNGTITSVKSDAFKVLFNGNTTAAGTVTAKRYELTAPSGISAAATTTLDLSTGNVLTLNLSANITTLTLTNTAVGTYLIKFIQNGTGSKTVAFPSDWLWSGGTVPTVTPTANKTDIVTLIYDGTTYYAAISQNF